MLIATSLCQVLVGCGAAFVARLWVFLSLYFVQGCLQCGIYILAFVLGEGSGGQGVQGSRGPRD